MPVLSNSSMARTLALAIDTIAPGTAKITSDAAGVYTVEPSPDQVPVLRNLVETAYAGKPSVTVKFLPVVLPLAIRVAAPYALAVLATTFFLGRVSKRSRPR